MRTVRTALLTVAAATRRHRSGPGARRRGSRPRSRRTEVPERGPASRLPHPLDGRARTHGGAPGRVRVHRRDRSGGTRYREFRTELDTNARQTITVAATAARAEKLAAELHHALETCLDRMKEQDPGLEGEAFYHGRVDIEDGAHLHSIDTSHPEVGSTDIGLYSVGRDGRAVTVVEWGQMGELDGAPLEGFRKTTRTAVAKLY